MKNKTLANLGTWLVEGDVGLSAKSLMAIYLGGNPTAVNWPSDAWDLRRCMAFLEHLPQEERYPLVERMAARNKAWKALKENWLDIAKIWEREKYTDMPQLQKIMQRIYVDACR